MYCGIFAWYIHRYTYDYFMKIQVTDSSLLKITSMVGFVNFLMVIPIFISLIAAFYIAKEFYKNKRELQETVPYLGVLIPIGSVILASQ